MPFKQDHLDIDDNVGYYVSVVVLVFIAVNVNIASSAATIYYWKKRMMQHTHPLLTLSNLAGSMAFAASSLALLGRNTDINCAVRVYFFNVSYTMAFSPYIVKALKFYQTLVLSVQISGFRGARSMIEVLPVLLFIFLDFIIISVTLYTGGGNGTAARTTVVVNGDGSYQEETYCGYHNNYHLFLAELIYKCAMIVTAFWLAFRLRIVLFKFSMVLAIDTAVKTTLGSAMLAVWMYSDDIPIAIVCAAIGICISAMVTGALNSIPAIMIAILGDHDAIGDIVEGMFDKKKEQEEVSTEYSY